MKAVRVYEYGDVGVLRHEEVSRPAIAPGEVLVRVRAAGVNPADCQIRAGHYRNVLPLPLPFIPGWDLAGTVETVGADVTRWRPGDRVFAMADMSRDGAYAQFIAIAATSLAPAPSTVPLAHAAGAPLALLTAWQSLFEEGALERGRRVLVHAAAGGVGQFTVQLARHAGAHVLATASPGNAERVRALGAEEVLDYRGDELRRVRDIDLIIDAAGGETRERSWNLLRPGGRLVAVAMPPPDPVVAARHGVECRMVAVRPDGARLEQLAPLFQSGALRVAIERELPLREAAAAHALSETRHVRGKIILRVE